MALSLHHFTLPSPRDGEIVTVTIRGELDFSTAAELREFLLAVGDERPDRIELDLGGLVFIDAAGARALDEAYHLLQVVCPAGLRNPRPSARRIFQLMNLMAEYQSGQRSVR